MADAPSIVARSADGMLHEFPAGTDASVIDGAMRQYAEQNAPAPPQEAPSGTLKGMGKAAAQTIAEIPAGLTKGFGASTIGAGVAVGALDERNKDMLRQRVDVMDKIDNGETVKPAKVEGLGVRPDPQFEFAMKYLAADPKERGDLRQRAINDIAESQIDATPEQRIGQSAKKVGGEIFGAGKRMEDMAREAIPLTPEEENRFSVKATRMVAGLAPYVAAGIAGGLPALVGYGGVEAFGSTYDEAKKAGVSDEDAAAAGLFSGMVQGGMMALPVGHAIQVMERIPQAFKGEFIKTVVEMAKSGATLTAFSQLSTLADNVVAKNTYDPTRKPLQGVGENIPEQMVAGAVLPVAAVGVAAAARRVQRMAAPKAAADQVMAAPTVDAAIDAANQVVDGTPVDTATIAAGAREFGAAHEQQQAKLLQLFGGLNRGTVEQAADGGYHFRTGEGENEQTIPLKVWDPSSAPESATEGQALRSRGEAGTIPPALAAAQRDHYGKLGIDVVYFENDPAIPFDGAVDPQNPNTIFLSNDPQRNAAQVGAHELTHVLESTRLPDGTSLGDVLHRQISEGITNEGWRHAAETFGLTAPERTAFPAGAEGDAAHADAVVSHLVRELGADIGGETPKFQTFIPKVIDHVEKRYGVDAAKDVLQKLMAGIRDAMRTLREFFSKPEEHAEYGQPETQSQHWVTNLDEIHDTLAQMYAVKFGTQAERENVGLAAMRDRAQRDRFTAGIPVEVPPPHAPEGFFDQATTEPQGLNPVPAAGYGEAAKRAATMRRWLGELDEKRRVDAAASPQAAFLRQTEAVILGKVRGVEDRLTKVTAERLATARQALDDLLNPKGDSPDMAKVREALLAEQQRMADAAAVGSSAAPMGGRSGIRPRAARQEAQRIRAVMPEAEAAPTAPERVAEPASPPAAEPIPERTAEPLEATPVTERPAEPVAPQPTEPPLSAAGRERLMRDQAAEQIRWAVEEGGIPPEAVPQIAHLYRPEPGEDPSVAFHRAVDQWITLEEARAVRVSMGDETALEEPYNKGERTADADTLGSEPAGTTEAARDEAPAPEAERPEGAAPGGEPSGGSQLPGEAAEGPALSPKDKAAFSPKQAETPEFKRWFGDSKVVGKVGEPLAVYHGTDQHINAFDMDRAGRNTGAPSGELGFFFTNRPRTAEYYSRGQYPNAEQSQHRADLDRAHFERMARHYDSMGDTEAAARYREDAERARGPNVVAAYLSLQNPLVHDFKGKVYRDETYRVLLERAKAEGRDGAIFRNTYDAGEYSKFDAVMRLRFRPEDIYVAFDPAQIKSATENRGTFDPNNPDIRMSPRVRTPEQIEADKAFATDKTVMEKIRGKMENLPENAVIQTLDRFYGIKADDPLGYMGLRLSNNAAGATEAFMVAATLKFDGRTYDWKERTGGVEALVKGLGPEAMDFAKWIAGHRAEILKAEGRENLLNDTQIRGLKSLNQGTLSQPYTLANGKTTLSREVAYLDALKKYHDLNKNVMDLLVESGMMKRDAADKLLANPFYIPFNRVDPRDGEQFVAPNSSSGSVKQAAFKKLKGGTEQLNDLWENATSNWAHLIEAALKNKNTVPVLKTAVQQGAAVKLTTQEALHLSDKEQKASTVWVMENGEKQYYRIEDKGLFAAVSVLDPVINVPVISPLARGAKAMLQTGVTMNPAFAVRNVTRDTQQVLATTPISWNVANNLYTGFKENNAARAIENLGRAIAGRELKDAGMSDIALSALASGALMRFGDVTDAGVRQTSVGSKGAVGKMLTTLNTPEGIQQFWEGLRVAGGAYRKVMAQSEDVSRIALFKQLKDQGLPTDFSALSAKDIADFSLTGASQLVRTLNSMSAFTNARMQGLYKVARSTADADGNVPLAVGTRIGAGIIKRVGVVVLAGALIDIALDAIYANDEDWKQRDDFDKNSNYWFKVGKTEFRIPKGFEVGAVSRLGAIFVESFYDKEMTAGRALTNAYSILANNLNLNPTPTALKPMLDIYGNSNAASGNPIVPRGMERLQADQRYTINNTQQARGISSAMNSAMRAAGFTTDGLSPIQIDYLARAYGGWLATTSMQMGDTVARALTSAPARPGEDRLAYWTGGIVSSEPRSSSRYVNMLYEQGEAIEKAYATYHDMLSQGRAAEAQEFFKANKDEIQKHGMVSGLMRLEGNLNRQIRLVTNNPDTSVTAEQKKLQIMQLTALKNRAAEQVFGAH